ncbi:MAG: SPOR domain-containing protein [Prevotellaceae bacterium]|nr:SPOR domain-containing protein [Prevotellaceae bacterium]
MELAKHIEILLLRNDCVIVPGLGGFTANHVAARYDDDDNLFIPPLRTLGFNPKLIVNDSLLVQSYTETYDLSYPEALNRIERDVDELKQHIDNNGSYELTDIGTLYLNDNGIIAFTPCEAGILTPELYSLSSFEMRKLAKTVSSGSSVDASSATSKNNVSVKVDTKPVVLDDNQEPDDAIVVNDESTIEDKSLKIKYSVLRNIAAVLIAVIVFFAWSNPIKNGDDTLKMSNIDNGIISHLIVKGYDKIRNHKSIALNNAKHSNTDNVTLKRDTVAKVNVENAQKEDFYCLVLASRVTKKNASAFVDKLLNKGFDKAEVLSETNKSVKVIYGHYSTKSEAYNSLNELKDNEDFYEAWVYQVKN